VLDHHQDDEQVGDFGKRQDRRIEEGHHHQAGCAEGERERLNLVSESPHTING